MKSLAPEIYYPEDQYVKDEEGKSQLKEDAVSFKVKSLTPMQFTEVMMEGLVQKDGIQKMTYPGIKLCLQYGLENYAVERERMSSEHIIEVSRKIFNKSALSEYERKNSSSQLK